MSVDGFDDYDDALGEDEPDYGSSPARGRIFFSFSLLLIFLHLIKSIQERQTFLLSFEQEKTMK